MTSVRSQSLVAHYFPDAVPPYARVWTCPDNAVTLIKAVALHMANGAGIAHLYLAAVSGAPALPFLTTTASSPQTVYWDGWIVLNPGDFAFFFSEVAYCHLWISGAVLLGPPPFARPPALQESPPLWQGLTPS